MKNRNALFLLASLVLYFFSFPTYAATLAEAKAACDAWLGRNNCGCYNSQPPTTPTSGACGAEKVGLYCQNETIENCSTNTYFPKGPGSASSCTPLIENQNTPGRFSGHDQCQIRFFQYGSCPEGQQFNSSTGLCEEIPECPAGQVKDPITGECKPPDCSGRKGEPQTSKVGISDDPPRMGCGGGCEFRCSSCGVISETEMGCNCKYTGNNCPIEESPPPTEGGGGDEGGGDEGGGDEGGGDEGGGDEGGGDEGGGGNGGLPNGCMKDESGTIWCVGDGDGDGEGDGDGKGKGIASGTCKEPPQMDGDPQLAGIHHQIWLQMCYGEHLKEDDVKNAFQNDEGLTDSDDLSLDDIKKDKTDDFNSAVNSALSGISMGSGTATCPLNDISGTIFGASYTIELTRVCPYFSLIRGAVLLFFFITSVNIIFQAIRD